MIVNELFYPKKDLKSLRDEEEKILANRVREHDKMSSARKIMKSHGFKAIGTQSTYASVFSHPNLSYVIKVFLSNDHCYMRYIKIVEQNPNPHFPIFRGKLMAISKILYGIRVEKLVHYHDSDIASAVDKYLRYVRIGADLPEWITETYPKLQEACDILYANSKKICHVDMHSDNIMMRPSDMMPVIIDPWSPSKSYF